MDYSPSGLGKPGEWTAYAHGEGNRAFWLPCGRVFVGYVQHAGGRIYCNLNGDLIRGAETVEQAMQMVEREIVCQVREMLPAYRAIHARVETAQAMKASNVTVLRPKKE
jgi:hypothetical protein